MATYAIGDIQGCFLTLQKLIAYINFDPTKDRLILLGDVINRGPQSLELLRFIKAHTSCITMVLGNHEIFAIALALAAIKSPRAHTLKPILEAPDKDELIRFLREQPLYIREGNHLFIHAGILPSHSVENTMRHADEISQILKTEHAKKFLARFFEKIPTVDKPDLKPRKALRLTLSSLIFLRMCESDTVMELSYNGPIDKAPKKLKPWFIMRNDGDINIFFGHWAALGLYQWGNYYCLDSGCVWGNKLTALRTSDKKIFQVDNCETVKS